ncbi:MAG: transporter related protein [Chloroflexi bacterium]|nr:transporter related protein [Chloroflexota bacterium]
MTTAIELRGLTRHYGRRRGIVDVSLDVDEGEVFGFLGPNGAGKTTTIRMLLGFMRPSAGSARVFGLDAWRDASALHSRLAYLSGEPVYLGELTAARLLDHLGGLRGLPRGSWRPLAERLDLDVTVQVRKLSRGNRQKVGVVQLFMGNEPLLIMDEPTTGLDPLMQRQFLGLIAEARAQGRTTFISSHNLQEVERSCDRVGIIREGRLVEIATVQSLLGEHWRSVNLVLNAPAPSGAFDLPNVRQVMSSGRDVHVMIRGDVNPFLRRLGALDVLDVAITTPDIEDVFYRFYEGDVAGSGGRAANGATGGSPAGVVPVPAGGVDRPVNGREEAGR